MAKDVSHNPWVFDAADQFEGWANRNEAADADGNVAVFQNKPFIDFILFESGATGGNYDVRDADGGNPISGIINLGANAQFQVSVGKYVDGIYIESFGTDGQILVYHGQEA